MYITATTQNWSKKCYMQYLFPIFNYTGYKIKTSIFHLSCSLPTEGTLNPSSDPLSLAHPSPEVPQWWGWRAEHFGHCITWGRSQSETTTPAEPSLPRTVGEGMARMSLGCWGGWKGSPKGRMAPASPGAVASPWHSSLSVAANSSWARLRAAAGPARPPQRPGCWARVPEVLGLGQLWQGEHRHHTSAWPHWAWQPKLVPKFLTWPQAPSPSAPWALQLSIALSCI